jgi:hypothetical protein
MTHLETDRAEFDEVESMPGNNSFGKPNRQPDAWTGGIPGVVKP